MKYIRTKDGIRKIVGENHILKSVSYYNTRGNLCSYKTETNRYKVDDTIEELCDEFVAIADDESAFLFSIYEMYDKQYVYINEESGEPLLETFIKNHIVYGAIWTDKGLIYVAKMNDKGELELL